MAILILNRLSKKQKDYEEWFSEIDDELYMLGHPNSTESFTQCQYTNTFENFMWNGEVDWEAVRIYKEMGFSKIISLEEGDLLRAGRLRSYLNIEGQSYESALAFRNKYIMKSILNSGGITTAPFKLIKDPIDLYEFTEEYGFPIVVKPLMGMNGKDVKVIYNQNDLLSWMKLNNWYDILVEKYIDGEIYHLDGLVIDGELKFSCSFAYINSCLSFNESEGVGHILLDSKDQLSVRLSNYVSKVLKVLPTPNKTSIHAEIFLTKDDELLLCEIASRTGGGSIPELLHKAYNVDFDRIISRSQIGISDPLPSKVIGEKLIGNYLFQPKDGILSSYPKHLPFDWVIDYKRNGLEGQLYTNANSSPKDYAVVYVEGETEQQIKQRITIVNNYMEDNTIWV